MASFALREGAVTVDLSLGRDGTLAATLALRPNPADPECLALGLRAAAPQGEAWNRSLDAVLARFARARDRLRPPPRDRAARRLGARARPGRTGQAGAGASMSSRQNTTAAAALARAEQRIAGYADHLHDGAYIGGVFGLADMAAIDGLLTSMVRSGDREAVGQANLFIQDAALFAADPACARALGRSRVLAALREDLRADDYFARRQAIHTLGRIGPRARYHGHLARSFPWYLEHDPLNVEDLLGELFWLGHRAARALSRPHGSGGLAGSGYHGVVGEFPLRRRRERPEARRLRLIETRWALEAPPPGGVDVRRLTSPTVSVLLAALPF